MGLRLLNIERSIRKVKNKRFRLWKFQRPKEIESLIMMVFSGISISIVLILSSVLYLKFSNIQKHERVNNTQSQMKQSVEKMEDYLTNMRQISDMAYYSVINDADFSTQEETIQNGLNFLYEANKDNLRSIAIYNEEGSLITAEPVQTQKEDPNITEQQWFKIVLQEKENMHFSTPHIQNLFDDGTNRYYTVLSLSRMVELTYNGNTQEGVLLVDMDYSTISRMIRQMNESDQGQYFYLCDSDGQIIFHPKQGQIMEGIYKEDNLSMSEKSDGIYDVEFNGQHRKEIIRTIGYTGWKIVGVIPDDTFAKGFLNIRYFIILIILLMAMMLMLINQIVSAWISRPIQKLNNSVKEYEAGKKPEIYIGGSTEIMYLGNSIQNSYEQIDELMNQIVQEQNEKRKSELDVLQSQINPHFLYNTLESITWMIEGEKNEEASFMVTQLAKLFRISLSKGRTIIPIQEELQHAQSYMNIQKTRYKDSFSAIFRIDSELENYCTVKLILQPILENAINYGVGHMEEHGEIIVNGKKNQDKIMLSVFNNGIGMSKEEVSQVLSESSNVNKHGSGVGLLNVDKRLKLFFGKEYGVQVESEPDEGTTVILCIPAIKYTEENRKILESGHPFHLNEMIDEEKKDDEQ